MNNEPDIFLNTLRLGEKVLGLSYNDYEDARRYAGEVFSGISEHFAGFLRQNPSLPKEKAEKDVVRYCFQKALEQRVSSSFYAETDRGNVCDIFYSPLDISLPEYPCNLPQPLERAVNGMQPTAAKLAQAISLLLSLGKGYVMNEQLLNAVQFLGSTAGYQTVNENQTFKGYPCADMLTRNELAAIAGENLCGWLADRGFTPEKANFTRDTPYNIQATAGDKTFDILVACAVAPETPLFIEADYDLLYLTAEAEGAIPLCAAVSLGAEDEQHFADGVILAGDDVRYKIDYLRQLTPEK